MHPAGQGQGDIVEARSADPSEPGQLARVWYDAWNDAHSRIVPAELTRLRTGEFPLEVWRCEKVLARPGQ